MPHTYFFQAEDGIRDHCVTGVQTCALPIFVAEQLRDKCSNGQCDQQPETTARESRALHENPRPIAEPESRRPSAIAESPMMLRDILSVPSPKCNHVRFA